MLFRSQMTVLMKSFKSLCWLSALVLFGLCTTDAPGAGAVTPFTTLEAEAGSLGGGATVSIFIPGSALPTKPTQQLEASGLGYVLLTNAGDSVSWTNPVAGANAMVIRSCLPEATNGGGMTATIDLYVDGAFRQAITLSSRQSWNYRGSSTTPDDPKGGGQSRWIGPELKPSAENPGSANGCSNLASGLTSPVGYLPWTLAPLGAGRCRI